MISQGKDITRDIVLETEVCVVGSGAGGGVLAKELSEAGISVVLIEEGSYRLPATFNFREDFMIPQFFQESGGRTTKDMGIIITHGKGIGGSTLHNVCLSFRPVPAIIERWRKEYGVSFKFDDLVPYFEKVEKQVEVNKIREDQVNRNNKAFRTGCINLGIKAQIPMHNRKNCAGCGFCEIGCMLNNKQNVQKVYIPLALNAGAKIFADCKAHKITTDGKKITGVIAEITNPETKKRYSVKIRSKVVAVAGGAINTPVLLIKSNIQSKNGLVGNNLHLHPYCPVGAFFDGEILGWRGIPQSMYCDDFAEFKKDGYGGFFMITGWAHPGTMASITPGFGNEHWEIMKEYSSMAAGGAMVHDETNGTVSVNRHGLPEISYWPEKQDQQTIIAAFKKMAEVYLAAGAKKVLLPFTRPTYVKSVKDLEGIEKMELKPRQITIMSVHPQGTCRMGEDPVKSVVNSKCEFHDIKGLFICDTSVYPTSLGTPPQIPTMSLGVMVADNIVKDKTRLLS